MGLWRFLFFFFLFFFWKITSKHNLTENIDARGVVIIADEDGQALEPVSWIPIILPRCANRVKAVLRFGDRLQLPPCPSARRYSELSAQTNCSLLDRHLGSHPLAVALNVQYRMQRVEQPYA